MYKTEDEPPIPIVEQMPVKVMFICAYIIVFVTSITGSTLKYRQRISIIGNTLTLLAIISRRTMRTTTNIFVANLATADLLVGALCVLQQMIHITINKSVWPFGELL